MCKKTGRLEICRGKRCLVCGMQDWISLYRGLVRCRECGFVTTSATHGKDELLGLYGPSYFGGDEYADYLGDKVLIQRNLGRRLRGILEYVSCGSLVEVGSAYGFFLELARRHFQVVGYEVAEDVACHARRVLGVPTESRDFLADETLAANSVDAVVMWDVIEHVAAPDRFVQRSAELLREGGYLFLTTGDVNAWLARWQGPRWRLIHPPTHLHYFSRRTLGELLVRTGFELVRVTYPGYWRSVHQIIHGIFTFGGDGESHRLYRVLRRVLPQKMGVYLNTYDIMHVVARRNDVHN